ncbi:nuclear pore complex protein Nup214 isoform X2 [Scaptodrosophila lebanonensis]|uniref:Nuclear pore complex protein Nup214 n=1 Tax=Drosophila lebanonensis TaxID=7225 RepID=A0A6J2U8U3_DROLE|nr:nuclear pore complex protein Nup214 isoform X2 [Scaptodrosophila lebanonensis]
MALNAPACKDTQDVQFKLHDKFVAFKECGEPRSNVQLLAISSSRGLLFAGNPSAPEMKVIIIKDLADAKMTCKQPQARLISLPSTPNYISCSADGNLLAVNYTQNGTSLLDIYSVQSFMTATVKPVYNIRLAPEDYVYAVQLLWNPVLPNNLAVVLSNGGLCMYALKEAGNFDMQTLDKSNQVKCGCWSPKGKQIVLGFPSGQLQQFKPDLTPAKTIVCPPNVHDAPFDTIAVHWLSTFQFAAVFLHHGEDCNPALYIVNAPKGAAPTYINYYDICYSLNGPRNHQFIFTHVSQWNFLLVTSANGVEVGVMGTTEAGDTPTWQQLTMLDEARIEMPLSEGSQEETFPLGFAYDTSTTHQLTINEQKLGIMPMVHVLSTDGKLLAFDFLNLMTGAVSVCSPPPPLADTSGQFRTLDKLLGAENKAAAPAAAAPPPKPEPTPKAEMSFAFPPNTVTSTPAAAKEKPLPFFPSLGDLGNKAPPAAAPASAPAPAPVLSFGAPTATLPSFGNPTVKPVSSFSSGLELVNNKPLYMVPSTFAPATNQLANAQSDSRMPVEHPELSDNDVEDVINQILAVQINAFSEEIQQLKRQTYSLLENLESPSSIKFYSKRLEDLQELNEQAQDVDFELDVQGLRQSLNESYAVVAECRARLEMHKNPEITRLMTSNTFDPTCQRILMRLRSYVAANEAQLRLAEQQIDTQWDQFQDVIRRRTKSKMHMPCLEGIYQRLTRLQNITSDERIKLNSIKAKLKDRGLLQPALLGKDASRTRVNETIDSLADSILSMSFSQVVDRNTKKLSKDKLQAIRKATQQGKINVIKPQRPDRVGLKSEVILETKIKSEQKKRASAAAAQKPPTAHKATQVATAVSAPAAPAPAPPPVIKTSVAKPAIQQTPVSSQFSFGNTSSSFVKATGTVTTAATNLPTPSTVVELSNKPAPALSMFGGAGSGLGSSGSIFNFSQAGGIPSKPTISFGGSNSAAPATGFFAGLGSNLDASKNATTKPKDTTPPKETPAVGGKPIETKKETTDLRKMLQPPINVGGFGSTNEAQATSTTTTTNTASASAFGSQFTFTGFGTSLGIGGASSTAPTTVPKAAPLAFGVAAPVKEPTASPATGLFAAAAKAATQPAPPPTGLFATAAKAATQPTPPATGLFAAAAKTAAEIVESTTTATFESKGSNMSVAPASIASAKSSEAAVTVVTPATTTAVASTTTESKDNLFGSVNICKPTVREGSGDSAGNVQPANVFSGFGNIAGNAGNFQFGADINAGGDASRGLFGTATTAAATTSVTTATSTSTAPSSVANVVTAVATSAVGTATTAPTTTTSPDSSSFSFSSVFNSLSTTSATPTLTSAPPAAFTAATTATTTGGPTSIFGGATSFATPTAAAAATTAAANPFQSKPFEAASPPAPAGNIFGGAPKPEQSVFGGSVTATAPPSGLFGSVAISSPSPFSNQPAAPASGGNIFSQAANTFGGSPGAPPSTSIFGGAGAGAASTTSPFGGSSIFGGGSANTTNQSPAGATAPAGGSIFGQSVFGQAAANATPVSGGNLFGGAASGGSIFGAANTATGNATSGGSLFESSSPGFGLFSQTTPASGGFGAFAQGGASVAQSGFGSMQPQQQQQPAAGGFGAKPVFGGSPSFGSPPTFGGAATFGSPKGFGAFGNATSTTTPSAFGAVAPAPKGNIFETLGSQESGLSFGNLAQTGNTNAQKPAFGGSGI